MVKFLASLYALLYSFRHSVHGGVAVEYAMIGSIVSIVILTSVTDMGIIIRDNFLGPVVIGLR